MRVAARPEACYFCRYLHFTVDMRTFELFRSRSAFSQGPPKSFIHWYVRRSAYPLVQLRLKSW
jgi:hypothetical protein